MRGPTAAGAAAAALVFAAAAPASNLLADDKVMGPILEVNRRGYALVLRRLPQRKLLGAPVTFCHSFVPQKPFPGYPSQETRPAAPGKQYRVTVIGPGVTPDLRWQGPAPPANDAAYDERVLAMFDRVLAGDTRCARER